MNTHSQKRNEVCAVVPAAPTKPWYQSLGRWVQCAPGLALATILCASHAQAQELIYKEDFNTDGEGTRYTVDGRGFVPKNGQVVPVPAGTSYWTRNTDVVAQGEVVGVPFPAPARRAIMLFNHALDPAFLTEDGKKLVDATIEWLSEGKTNMVVMFSAPHGACDVALGDCYLVDTLTAAGHTVIDDDVTTYPVLADMISSNKVDLIINSSTGGDPIRLANATVPLLCFASDLAGDMLLATRALVDTTFDPGDVKVEAPTHPIAAGLPATFKFVTEAQPFDTVGLGLPAGSITVASYQFTDAEGVVSTHPFLVTTEKGVQLLGGLVSGMEGSGYWAGADLNEPNISTPPDDPPRAGATAGRTLTLNPVNVTGKPNLKLTFALAGTEVDFDGPGGDDYLSIKVDLNNTGEFIELARYGSPTVTEKFLVEMIKGGDGMGGPAELVIPDYSKRVGIVAKDFTYDIPDGATQLVVRFESLSTFWNEIVAFDNIRITSGDIVGGGGPVELGQTVNGFQDDFTSATRNPDWQAFGPGGDRYVQADGLLYVSPSIGDPNHLLYMKSGYSNDVQEVLARIRATAFGPMHDYPRGGVAVGVQANPTNLMANPGYNLHFRDSTQNDVPSRQFKLLDDARAWGPAGLRTNVPPQTTPGWTNNVWYWLRLRVAPKEDGTNNLFGKVWVADGVTPEPTDWQLRWSDAALPKPLRAGFAGIAGSSADTSNNGLAHFEVDYILIKAAGLPEITVNFSPTGPPPTVPRITGITKLPPNRVQIDWIGEGTLEQATTLPGPFAPVPASSAIGVITATGPGRFYRLVE